MNKKILFKPELALELFLSSDKKGSRVKLQNKEDAVTILEGVKKLTSDHLAIIYLDENNVVVEVETFIRSLDAFNFAQATRAITSVIVNQNKDSMIKVVVAQTLPHTKKPDFSNVRVKELVNFAWRLSMFNVNLVDFILIGNEYYYSFREDKEAWKVYVIEMQKRLDISEGPFIPNLADDTSSNGEKS